MNPWTVFAVVVAGFACAGLSVVGIAFDEGWRYLFTLDAAVMFSLTACMATGGLMFVVVAARGVWQILSQ